MTTRTETVTYLLATATLRRLAASQDAAKAARAREILADKKLFRRFVETRSIAAKASRAG